MIRKIIEIDEEKCNGCGACALACHEGAIGMVNGKAKLLRDDYCDGLGDCLPACPEDAISFIEREAADYDEEAVRIARKNWPIQIKLAPVRNPSYDGRKLLIAADCTAFSYPSFHEDFMKNHICLIGCPKLDGIDYSVKLSAMIKANDFTQIDLVRMHVPCCGGMLMAVQKAIMMSKKTIPLSVTVIDSDGNIL